MGDAQDDSEPPVREFADRGVIWLLASPRNLQDAVRLLSEELADRLDFAHAERQNRSFIPEDLHKQEADLLFRVPFSIGRKSVWVYVLLEHQSQPAPEMGFRLLSYMIQIWQIQVRAWKDAKVPPSKWNLHPIIPVVFYTGKRRWKAPIGLSAIMETTSLLDRFIPQWETLFLNLHETPSEALANSGSPVAQAFRAMQAAGDPTDEFVKTLYGIAASLDTLDTSDSAIWNQTMRYLYRLVQHTRRAEEQKELFAAIESGVRLHRKALRETDMTGAQVLINQGRKEGREEGREEVLIEQLRAKFGQISEETEGRVRSLTAARSLEVARGVLTANTLADLGL